MIAIAGAIELRLPLIAAAADGELVTMWRIELLHPATMHFSIALTLVGTVFWLLGGTRRRWPRMGAFDFVGIVTIVIAAIAAWVAVQTGIWADEVVGRELYDPRPLKDHENLAITFSWLITATAAIDIIRRFRWIPPRLRATGWMIVAIALLVANALLISTAHLGAGLVYQQGAGVQMPAAD